MLNSDRFNNKNRRVIHVARYHINKHGVPAICRAKPGNCPLGGDESHFSSQEEAQEHADKINSQEHGVLPGMNEYSQKEESKRIAARGPIPRDIKGKELDDLVGKDVRIAGIGRGVTDGPVYSVDQSGGKRLVRIGTTDGVEVVDLDDKVQFINASKENYYNPDYRKAMRDINRPLHEFRFNKDNIKDFKDKYVEVKYDGKSFEGKVIDTSYIEEHNSGLIIESEDGQVKHIKSYRMTDLEVVSDNENDFKHHKEIKKFSNEALEDIRNLEEPDVPQGSEYDPDEEVDRYFSDVIKQKKGEDVDLSKHNVDWEEEVEDRREAYSEQSLGREGDVHERWTSSSEEAFEDDMNRAVETNEYYFTKKDMVDDIVKKAESTDWTKHGKTQEQGVIDALEYIRDRDLLRNY